MLRSEAGHENRATERSAPTALQSKRIQGDEADDKRPHCLYVPTRDEFVRTHQRVPKARFCEETAIATRAVLSRQVSIA
jgi:hypothetical protein